MRVGHTIDARTHTYPKYILFMYFSIVHVYNFLPRCLIKVRPADDPQDMLVRNTRNMTISDDNKENSVVGRGRVSMSCG